MTRREDVFVAVAVLFSSCSKTRARQLAAAKSRDLLPLAFTFTVIRGKIIILFFKIRPTRAKKPLVDA